MKKIEIKTKNTKYDILIGKNILENLAKYIQNYDKILIFSNETVAELYFPLIQEKFKNFYYFTIPDGEEYKNIENIYKVYDFMIDNQFTRKSVIISLGGGVICDMGGFVGATYMRGIDFIQIPTTLLSQVDASVGGKTAIDYRGKNMIGAFKQPKLVLIDITFLSTLPQIEFRAGMGEVIKYSFLTGDNIFHNFLLENAEKIKSLEGNTIIELIYNSVNIKKYYVENDELENGIRAYLNLGHTYAHALEILTHYKIKHGLAVAKGVVFELSLSERDYISTINLYEKYGINAYPIYFEKDEFLNALQKDKKNSFGNINFILFGDEIYKASVGKEKIIKTIDIFRNRYIKGIIDIGTNSIRLFLAQIYENDNNIVIENSLVKGLTTTRLGEDVSKNGYLLESAMDRSCNAIIKYLEIAKSYGVSEIKALATSAVRDSSNRQFFIDKVKNKTNIKIDVISGEMEARFTFLGASLLYGNNIMTIDIGGGSTEFATKNSLKSIQIGAVRLLEMFGNDIIKMSEYIRDVLQKEVIKHSVKKVVGVAGSITTQVAVLKKLMEYEPNLIENYELTLFEVEQNLKLFLSLNLKERSKLVGEKRAEVIIPGTIILLEIMKYLGIGKITVSESDNLNGAMISKRI